FVFTHLLICQQLVQSRGELEAELLVESLAIPDNRGANFGRNEVLSVAERRERNACRNEELIPAVLRVIGCQIGSESVLDDFGSAATFPGIKYIRGIAGSKLDGLLGFVGLAIDAG